MSVHKSQSSTSLILELDQVPKRLGHLKSIWAPSSFVVSFKLETNIDIMLVKAQSAIVNYGVDLVVANLLQTRRFECFLLKAASIDHCIEIRCDNSHRCLESFLIPAIIRCHREFMIEKAEMSSTESNSVLPSLINYLEAVDDLEKV